MTYLKVDSIKEVAKNQNINPTVPFPSSKKEYYVIDGICYRTDDFVFIDHDNKISFSVDPKDVWKDAEGVNFTTINR